MSDDLKTVLTEIKKEVSEIKTVLKGDEYGNEGVVTRLNKVERKVLYWGSAGAGILTAVELYHNFLK